MMMIIATRRDVATAVDQFYQSVLAGEVRRA
jgi:hypothetical protein